MTRCKIRNVDCMLDVLHDQKCVSAGDVLWGPVVGENVGIVTFVGAGTNDGVTR